MGISAIWNYYTVHSRTRSTPNHSPVTLCIVLYSCAIHQNVILVTILVSSDYESKTFDMKQLKEEKRERLWQVSFNSCQNLFFLYFFGLALHPTTLYPGVLSCVSVTFISIETSFLAVLKTQENMKRVFFFNI